MIDIGTHAIAGIGPEHVDRRIDQHAEPLVSPDRQAERHGDDHCQAESDRDPPHAVDDMSPEGRGLDLDE
jgi:hypothetical protein